MTQKDLDTFEKDYLKAYEEFMIFRYRNQSPISRDQLINNFKRDVIGRLEDLMQVAGNLVSL